MTTTRFAIDNLIEVPAQHIAVMEILKGTFDDEIKRVTAMRDELKARQSVDQTLEKAAAALADAKSKQAEADMALAGAKFQAEQLSASAQKKMVDAQSQAQQVASDAARIASDRAVFEADKANTKELHDQRSAALDLRESQLATAAAKIGQDQRKLALEQEAFNRKLDALKI